MTRNLLLATARAAICGGLVLPLLVAAARADDSLAEAERLRLTGRYEEAAEHYEGLARQQPVAAAVGWARCQAAVGQSDAAEKRLQEAVSQHPQAAVIHAELAELAFQRGDYAAAERHVAAALQQDQNQLAARWYTAELHRVAGRLKEADRAYEWLIDYSNQADTIDDPEALRWIGLAAAQYARWHRNHRQFRLLVNQLYPAAWKAEPNYWPAHLETARLFLEKYNRADATSALNAARAINPHAAEIHALQAQLALQSFNLPAAQSAIDRALELNPRLLLAHQLQADRLLADLRPREAIERLQHARQLNPVDEPTLGRLAAAYGAVDGLSREPADSRMAAVIDQAVQRNPHCGQFFASLAASLELMRRFPQAAHYYEQAQQRLPQLIGVRGQLGLMYMRLGEEARAARLLEESFQIDPFNVRVKNMLEVLDVLQGYAVLETEHFVIKFDRGQDELLARFAARYLEEEVYPEIVQQMGYAPKEKSLFEIFSRARNTSGHGWFSARMVGLPYVGTVGACAGKVVALVSPNDLPQKFNWARVLRHEFVHVVNLQQTDFNIPHWYTEALAVRNEGWPPPPNWMPLLARRAWAGQLFNLETINGGFIRPSNSDDWALAYCQAALYADYLVHAYGDEALTQLLDAYAANQTTAEALPQCFGVEQADFEAGYRHYLDQLIETLPIAPETPTPRLADLQRAARDDPQNADRLAELARAYLQRGDQPQARQWARAARKQAPHHQLGGYVLARLQLASGNPEQAIEMLQESLDRQQPQPDALGLLAGLKLKAGDFEEAARLYQLGGQHDPYHDKWLKALARVYLQAGQDEQLAPVLAQLAQRDPDNLIVRKKLSQLALQRQDHAAGARWANQALQIDVLDAELHAMLAQALRGQQQHARAIEQYEMAIELQPRQFAWRMALAEVCQQTGQVARARQVVQQLLEIAPNYPGAQEFGEALAR